MSAQHGTRVGVLHPAPSGGIGSAVAVSLHLFFGHPGHIHKAEQVPHGLHIGRVALPLFREEPVVVEAQHRNDHAACTAPGHAEAERVQIVLACICPQKADRGLGIDELCRQMPLCAAAHLHESHGVPGFGQELEIRHLAVLVDAAEAVAIEPEDHRTLRGGRLCGLRGRGRVRALLRLVVAEDAAHLTVVLERQHQREIQIQRLPAEILHMGIDDVIQQEDRRTINAGVNGSTHG